MPEPLRDDLTCALLDIEETVVGTGKNKEEDRMDRRHCGHGASACPHRRKKDRRHGVHYAYPLGLFVGFISLIWFLIRVIPKPSRAAYPCQRVAAPLASGFVIWLMGLAGAVLARRRVAALHSQARPLAAALLLMAAGGSVWLALELTDRPRVSAGFVPSEPPNMPIGEGRGVYPGRVVWVYEPDVTRWDGRTGDWWDDENTDPELTDLMVSEALRSLAGQRTDAEAWDALFRYFNRTVNGVDRGYQAGEKIAIKLNMNQDRNNGAPWRLGAGMPSPQVIHSLIGQLINVVGVAGRDIVLYDATRYIGDPIFDKIHYDANPEFQQVRLVVVPWMAINGREKAYEGTGAFVHFAYPGLPNGGNAWVARCAVEATYLINMALPRSHESFGMTATAKNHFGSIEFPEQPWGPGPLHNPGGRVVPLGTYSCLVELIGSKHLGGKTLLYIADALYPAVDNSGEVIPFRAFDNDWCSSLFMSQDPVAIDSVCLDFLGDEPASLYVQRGLGLDNYLHEAALAYDPPSRTLYRPDGIPLPSLGVHEHWNNPIDRQYSRNLGLDAGIELVAVRLRRAGELDADLVSDGVVDERDLAAFCRGWLAVPGDSSWSESLDLSGDQRTDFRDWASLAREWGGRTRPWEMNAGPDRGRAALYEGR